MYANILKGCNTDGMDKKKKKKPHVMESVEKANPYHDKEGKFTSKDKSASVAGYTVQDASMQDFHDALGIVVRPATMDQFNAAMRPGESRAAYNARRMAEAIQADNPGMSMEQAKAKESSNFQNAFQEVMGTRAKPKTALSALDKGVRRIARLTDINDHGKSLAEAAKLVGRDDLAKEAMEIRAAHTKLGHLSSELSNKRRVVYDKTIAHAKKVLSAEDYKKLYGAL